MPRPKTYCEASPLVGSAGQDICRAFRQSTYPSRYSFIEWVKVLIDNINSRFHSVHASGLDYRNSIHSIEAFESIVAFKINRAACISGQARQSLKTPAAPEVLPLSVDHP